MKFARTRNDDWFEAMCRKHVDALQGLDPDELVKALEDLHDEIGFMQKMIQELLDVQRDYTEAHNGSTV